MTSARCVTTVLASTLMGVLACAGAAVARPAPACQANPNSTVLEDGAARVFTLHGRDYACLRPSGRPYLLNGVAPQNPPPDFKGPIPVAEVQLAGRFVAWEEGRVLYALDVKRRKIRGVGAADSAHQSFGGYVLNAHGTVVWLLYHDGLCQDTSILTESTPRGDTTLASATNSAVQPSGSGCAPGLTDPIKSLGLSESGDFAYWRANGELRGAAIP